MRPAASRSVWTQPGTVAGTDRVPWSARSASSVGRGPSRGRRVQASCSAVFTGKVLPVRLVRWWGRGWRSSWRALMKATGSAAATEPRISGGTARCRHRARAAMTARGPAVAPVTQTHQWCALRDGYGTFLTSIDEVHKGDASLLSDCGAGSGYGRRHEPREEPDDARWSEPPPGEQLQPRRRPRHDPHQRRAQPGRARRDDRPDSPEREQHRPPTDG